MKPCNRSAGKISLGPTAAILEVILVLTATLAVVGAFARSPVGAWERVTFGRPFVEYLLMMALPLVLGTALGRSRAEMGVAFTRVRRSLVGAMVCMVPYAAAHALLAGVPAGPAWHGVAGSVLALLVLLVCTRLLGMRPGGSGLLVVAPLPLVLDPGTVAAAGSALAFHAFFLGPGEEILFRGYIHSRLNRAFGRTATIGGQRCGWAVPLTAALFGLYHAVNLPELYVGHWAPVWWAGLAAFGWGLFFGWLRDWGGSVLTPAAVHGIPQGVATVILGG